MKPRRRKKSHPLKEEPFTVVEIEDFETVCHVCDAEFLDGEDLKLHIAQVHFNEPNGKTICKLCYSVLPAADAFVSHFIFRHLENSSFCFYCYRAFTDPLTLDQHELKHCAVGDESTVVCSQCPVICTNRQELQNHEYQEHRNSEDGIMLNSFFSLLSSALNTKIKDFLDCLCKNEPFMCRKCNHVSSHVKDFIEHLKNLKCKCFACDKCYTVYKKKHSIMNHMLQKSQCHNYVKEKKIKKSCSKCDKFFDLIDISAHEKTCSIVKCSMCKKLFNSIYELTDHRTEEHEKSISLETCKFCKKQFVGTLNLKKHMSRSHKNKSLYKYNCVHCGSMFNHPSKLFAHFFTQHKEIEPYTCKICNKCYRLRKHFTIHIKLHHNSVGFVEFEENLHVIFTDKKSENPINPHAYVDMASTTDASDSDCIDVSQGKNTINANQLESKLKDNAKPKDNDINTTQLTILPDKKIDSNEMKPIDTAEMEHTSPKVRQKRKQRILRPPIKIMDNVNSPDQLSDSSEEKPLSNIKNSLLQEKTENLSNFKQRWVIRDKRAKLTCKICNKYCYTVQNYHHHLTLHEKRKMKRCIKCNEYFKSRKELKNHIESSHSSSKLIETLKSVLEKRKKIQSPQKPGVRPGESFKSVLEKRKKQQIDMVKDSDTDKFQRTIKKVDIVDDCTATITPVSDHGLSVKNFIENFRPEVDSVNISNSVTIKALNSSVEKEPLIKMRKFNPEPLPLLSETAMKLNFPVKYKETPGDQIEGKVSVKLVQKLITKPKLVNMCYNERIPLLQDKAESNEYCNMFADETDYTQYKNDTIPEVAHEVMLENVDDIPRTRRLAQEIIIPKIPEEHGEVRIGHLLPQAPFYKIVKVKKLLKSLNEESDPPSGNMDKDVKLPDGTRLIAVKNPFSHLIPNEHLEEVLKANRTKYYTPTTKNIEKAIAKALNQVRPPRRRKGRKKTYKDS